MMLASSFIQVKVTNPSKTAIKDVTLTYRVGSGQNSLSPDPAINYTRDAGIFLYAPGDQTSGVTNQYALNKKSSFGTPAVTISADRRTATWSGVKIRGK